LKLRQFNLGGVKCLFGLSIPCLCTNNLSNCWVDSIIGVSSPQLCIDVIELLVESSLKLPCSLVCVVGLSISNSLFGVGDSCVNSCWIEA
jgi:hypothetical protein